MYYFYILCASNVLLLGSVIKMSVLFHILLEQVNTKIFNHSKILHQKNTSIYNFLTWITSKIAVLLKIVFSKIVLLIYFVDFNTYTDRQTRSFKWFTFLLSLKFNNLEAFVHTNNT